ncbi:molybdopterin-dependent oxidoreductase [Streptomyces endophytica]|uniref:Molybdopterin-dependent oxidoreductase n=1 Tax=Streptomyces endophytica TaxID=2991496 RepID=A0ABY6PFI9_9ACTN|nr:molybdopterin-dependent oxidoreductase [Streptomyces endophytica]UZJ32634.1 molybdopterin-dependent oxidoreductase [Streptomyces endophytica]
MRPPSPPSRTTTAVRPTPADTGAPAPRPLEIRGQLRRPLALTVAQLRERWPRHRAEVVFDCATNGPQRHTFEGVLLRDVLDAAGPAFDASRRKDRSRYLLAVSGGDGHHTVLSWAEIDADFGDAPVLLATAMDGRPLDAAGSQLVVPSDRCGARYISTITGIWVGTCAPPEQP